MEPYAEREYEPIQPRHTDWRGLARKAFAPILVLFGIVAKLGFLVKFAAIFVAFGSYTLFFSWQFALGLIVLIFLHEMGHFLEARREGLHPSWPVFIPFFGAYVKHTRGNPWQTTRVAIAGPILGGLAALVCYAVAESNGSSRWFLLAYYGFFLNLFNLLPVGILDGGAVWRSTRWLWHGGGREKALISGALYAGTALLLAVGMFGTNAAAP